VNNGFTFGGIKKSYITVREKKRPITAPIRRNLVSIPGYKGALIESTDVEVLIIPVLLLIEGYDQDEYRRNCEDFAAWIVQEKETELIFDDDPNRVYYAAVQGSFDPNEIVRIGEVQVNFLCPDPHKYGHEKYQAFSSETVIDVEGTAEAEPVISCTISADTTYVAISNGEEINLIGNPVKQEQTSFEPETAILKYTSDTLTGWTNSSSTSIEGAEQSGTLKTDGANLYTDDYGTGAGWHGPAQKTSLSSSIQDFRLDVGFDMRKTGNNQAGGLTVDLLDANSKIVASIMMTKHYGGLDTFYGKVRAGNQANGHDVIQEGWANYARAFNGVMRLYRRGNVWTAQVFYRVDGKFLSPVTHSWTDDDGIATAAITQVQARLLQRGSFPVVSQVIADINVNRLNDPAAGQVPIIARAGDVVEFDHANDIIRLNGEDITREKAFIGDYFVLKPGENTIICEPANAILGTEIRWRERWK
jgi:predicted phage tail component-like protein